MRRASVLIDRYNLYVADPPTVISIYDKLIVDTDEWDQHLEHSTRTAKNTAHDKPLPKQRNDHCDRFGTFKTF